MPCNSFYKISSIKNQDSQPTKSVNPDFSVIIVFESPTDMVGRGPD